MATSREVLQAIRGATATKVELAADRLTIDFDHSVAVVADAPVEPLTGSEFVRRIPVLDLKLASAIEA
ncbi:MAG TPA: hypothetical protein VKS25_10045 [Solirubrobacteraceae bacterium]|nr:hypothetical protein [Solirubrobacteraceae bacterium]